MWSDPKLFFEIGALTYVPGNTLVSVVLRRTRLVFMPQTVGSKYSLKMGGDQWIVLSDLGANRWQVQLWGPETMQVNCIGLTTKEAQEHAMALVSLFLLDHNPDLKVPTSPEWRTVFSRGEGRHGLSRGQAG